MARSLGRNKINLIIYALIGTAIVLIILFISIIANSGKISNSEANLQAKQIENSTNQSTEEANSQIGKNVEELKQESIENEINVKVPENTENLTNENSSTENNTPTNAGAESNVDSAEAFTDEDTKKLEKKDNQEQIATQDPTFSSPVDGEIAKKYGKDKLIYSDTLKEWTTHLGIDIKADKTTIVKASADGIIKSIKNDPRYGLTIVIEHANGFSSVYANLLTAEFVVVGENVKSGQTIGTVGNSATFEILDDPHLHFEILKDGNNIDPEMYIK